jgi:hypothetical protein
VSALAETRIDQQIAGQHRTLGGRRLVLCDALWLSGKTRLLPANCRKAKIVTNYYEENFLYMFKRQQSIRLGLALTALVLISIFTFASTGGYKWLVAASDEKAAAVKNETTEPVQPANNAMLVPLSGTKNIPGDYADLTTAMADLNVQGVGAGGVTFNVIAGNPQTAPLGGYVIGGAGSQVLTTTSVTQPVTIQCNANTVTAPTPQTVGSLNDAIFKLIGADFITIQNCQLQENAANIINATAATNNMTEFGVAMFYVTTTDGAQNNTITGNNISLSRTYANTFGIYSNVRHSSTAMTTTADITAATGANSGNKVYSNNISNVNYGTAFIGSGTAANQDSGNDIGGGSAGTANTYANWGGLAALSSYVSNSGTSYCIFMNHQNNDNVSFNNITSATVTGTAVTFAGIRKDYTTASPTGTITTNINNNTITLTNGFTSGTFQHILSQGMTALSTATININNNTIINSAVTGAASSSTMVGIINSSVPGILSISNNVIRGNTSTATTGGFTGISNTGAVTTTININNNQIGNSTSGAITFSAATSGAVTGISNTGAAAAAALSINSNNFQGFVHSVAGSSTHQYILWAHASSATDNINGNTFTNLNINTTGGVVFLTRTGNMTATGVENVNSNSIVTAFNKGGAGGTITLFGANTSSVTGSAMTNNLNNFSNITVTGSTIIAGWSNTEGASSTSSPNKTVTNNTFNNWVGGSSSITGMSVNFSGPTTTVNTNTISNISGAAAITGLVLGSSNQAVTASGNIIDPITTTGAAAVTGISATSSTSLTLTRNKIYDLAGNNAGATVNGILITGGVTMTVSNNLIGNLTTTNGSGTDIIRGISSTSTTASSNINLYFNTIYINASTGGANLGTSGVFHTTSTTATTAALTMRNNIIVNTSTAAGTGLTVAYRRSSGAASALANYAAASNNNDFYAGAPSATNLIYADGTSTAQTITTYKNGVFTAGTIAPRDSASISENPPFLSTTGANANFLHIDPAIATQIESGGTPVVGIIIDFDGDTRNVSTPDIGADEGNFTLLDLVAPSITYTALPNTSLTTNRTLSVTITDASGVASGANLPRIYFKKSTDGSYVSTQCVMTGGTALNGTYDCLIDNTLVGGGSVVLGDIIQYFVVAQDIAGTPNVGSNPSAGFSATSVNSITTPPTTPNSYTIVAAFASSVTVGSGGTYPSLTNVGGLFEAMNAGVFTGSTTITIISDLAGETGTVALNQLPEEGMGAGTFTVTIKPSGVARVITGTSAVSLIKLSGTDRVTIDGSLTGGTDRSLTINNIGTGAVIWIATNANSGANNDTVKNTILNGGGSFGGQGIIAGSGAVFGNPAENGRPNSNNTIQNNAVTRVQNGVFTSGDAVTLDQNWTIANNTFGSAVAADKLSFRGILVSGAANMNVVNNSISGILSSTSTSSTMSGIMVLGNISGGSITRNQIKDIRQVNTTGWGSNGIYLAASSTASNLLIANNFVSDIISQGFNGNEPADNGYGIVVEGTGGGYNIYHNTVVINGNETTAGITAALLIDDSEATVGAVNLRNNILANTQTNGVNYSVFVDTPVPSSVFSAIDYNDYFTTEHVGSLAVTNRTTLANWQTATGSDVNSKAVDPTFVSATDFHLLAGSPMLGMAFAGLVNDDVDNELRDNVPDIGADEIISTPFIGSVPAGSYSNANLGTSTLSGNVNINGTLTLSGIVTGGANTLSLGCAATVVGQGLNNYVIGNVRKDFCATGLFIFPVGTTPDNMLAPDGSLSEYSPFTANVTAIGTIPSSLTVSVTDAFLTGSTTAHSASRYWDVTESGDLTADITFVYLNQDVAGTESSYQVLRREMGVTAVYVGGTVNTGTNEGSATGVTNFSQWAAGNLVPTAASVDIAGRVTMADGLTGIPKVRVTISGAGLPEPRVITTSPFGYYNFADLPVGTYVLTVNAKQYTFNVPSRVVTAEDNIVGFDFLANP